MTGRLFAVVGPSGAGKDTLLAGVCGEDGPHWVRRVITRPEALGGEPYEGVDAAEFARRDARGEFALVWHAHGLDYGIPKAELSPRARGQDVVFNGSRSALGATLAAFPEVMVIHITAPAPVLAARLAERGRETTDQIAARLARVPTPWPAGQRVIEICNDSDPETGIARLRAALQDPDRGARWT